MTQGPPLDGSGMDNTQSHSAGGSDLVAALSEAACAAKLPMQPQDLSDVFWLLAARASDPVWSAESVEPARRSGRGPGDVDSVAPDASVASRPGTPARPATPVFPAVAGSEASGAAAAEVGLPHSDPIADALEMTRALRPFKRIREPGPQVLDLDATIEATAQARGALVPVLRSEQLRRLDVALVVDGGRSLGLWDTTFAALERVLAQVGAFRSVARWELVTNAAATGASDTQAQPASSRSPALSSSGPILIRDALGQEHPADRLTDPSGRRLVLLVTDTVSGHWYDPRYWAVLERWGQSMPTTILHLLPEHYWSDTALGDERVSVRAPWPASPNTVFDITIPWWLTDSSGEQLDLSALAIPIVPLTAPSIAGWADAIAAGSAGQVTAALTRPRPAPPIVANVTITPADRVRAFRRRASPGAQRLAETLAAAPILTRPLIQLLQDMLPPPTAGVLELAEVFVGGLLEQVPGGPDAVELAAHTGDSDNRPSGDFLLRFRLGVAELLTSSSSVGQAWRTFAAITQHLNASTGVASGSLTGLVPDATGPARRDPELQPFAELHAALATRLGLSVPNAPDVATITGPGRPAVAPPTTPRMATPAGPDHMNATLSPETVSAVTSISSSTGVPTSSQPSNTRDGSLLPDGSPFQKVSSNLEGSPRHVSVFFLDVRNFSRRDTRTQVDWRTGLRTIIEEAVKYARLPADSILLLQDRGDGFLGVVDAAVSNILLVADFVHGLQSALRSYNRDRNKSGRIRLRIALHQGEVIIDGAGVAGDAIVVAARLLDSAPLRRLLDSDDSADLALALSPEFYQSTVAERHSDLDPAAYREVTVTVPNRYQGKAWVTLPSASTPPLESATTTGAEGQGTADAGRTAAGQTAGRESEAADLAAGTSGGTSEAENSWDFFVSYTNADVEWARKITHWLIDAGYQVFSLLDLAPGADWRGMMSAGITGADRTVAVASRSYLSSAYGTEEWRAARAADPAGILHKLLVIRIDEDSTIDGELGEFGYTDLAGVDDDTARRRLLKAAQTAIADNGIDQKESVTPSSEPEKYTSEDAAERLTDVEIMALSRTFSSPSQISHILDRAGLPHMHWPSLSQRNSIELWREIAALMENGLLKDGRHRILTAASRSYPANEVFQTALDSPTTGMPAPDTPATAMGTGVPVADDTAGSPAGIDFFVSYTTVDEGWAEWVAWQLEVAGYRVRIQAWDFVAGSHFVAEMLRAAQDAARTVTVLSEAYLSSSYAEAAWQAAWAADQSGRARKLLAFRVEDCDRPGLLGQVISVDLFGVDRDTAVARLIAAARSVRGKPKTVPAFPGRQPQSMVAAAAEPVFPDQPSSVRKSPGP